MKWPDLPQKKQVKEDDGRGLEAKLAACVDAKLESLMRLAFLLSSSALNASLSDEKEMEGRRTREETKEEYSNGRDLIIVIDSKSSSMSAMW